MGSPKVIVKSKNGVDCYFTERLIGKKNKLDLSWFQSAGDRTTAFFAESKSVVEAAYETWGKRWPHFPIVDDAKQRVDKNYIALFSQVENRNLFRDHMTVVDFSQHPGIKNVYAAYREFAQQAVNPQFRRIGMNTGMPQPGGSWKWDFNQVGQVGINKAIAKVLVRTFKQIFLKCIEIKYYIWSVQTLCYRTKSTKGTKMYFSELQSGAPVPFEDLSNHSLGLAIDINPSTNWDGDTIWDMPVELVKIFRDNGFWWGGEYSSRYDTMHFEYKLPFILENDRPVCMPLSQISSPETPAKYYKQNESGPGGFYPIGLSQNLHAGIHLPVENAGAGVYCSMNGYIIAARLMADGQAGDNAILQKFIGNQHLGFILIRHEVEKVQNSGNLEIFPLYSLYMHLAPSKWGDAEDPYAKNVPWFKKILGMSFGGVVDLDPSSVTVGTNFWASEQIPDKAPVIKVSGGKTLKSEVNGIKTTFVKPLPDDVRESLEAFKDGHLVTFSSAVLPVSAGELIGYLNPRTSSSAATLHWEVFSPAEKSGLEILKSIDTDVAKLFQRISELREDNFFEMPGPDGAGKNELEPLLVDKLPPGDQGFMRGIISTESYMQKLKSFFNEAKSFADESLDDAKTAKTFSYPLSISVKNPYGYTGPSSNTPVEVKVSFKKDGKTVGTGGTLTIKDFSSMNFNVQVPADADTICLQSEDCLFESVALSDLTPQPTVASSLKPLLPYRWRNILLSHVAEWNVGGLNPLLDMLEKKKYLDPFLTICKERKKDLVQKGLIQAGDEDVAILKKLLLPLVWWGRQIDPALEIYGGEHAVCGAEGSEKSLFGTLLPSDGKIDSMHPVTAMWLVQMLEAAGKIKITGKFPVATFTREEDGGRLLWKGWVAVPTSPALGDQVHFVAIQHGYGSGATIQFSAVKSGTTTSMLLGSTVTAEGAAVISKRVSTWGTLTLKVSDDADSEISCDDTSTPQMVVATPQLENNVLTVHSPDAKSSFFSGTVSFKENCPKSIDGFLYLRYWTALKDKEPDYSKEGTTFAKTLLVTCSLSNEEVKTIRGVQYKGDFVVGGKGAIQGVQKFDISEFMKVYEGDKKKFIVYLPLCQKLQAIRGEKDQPKIKIESIAADGRAMVIHPISSDKYDAVAAAAEKLKQPGVFEVSEEGNNRLKLSMPESKTGSGTLSLSFDPSGLFDALLADINPEPTMKVFTRPSLLMPNGGHEIAGEHVEKPSILSEKSPDQIKSLCNRDFLDAHADTTFPPLQKQGYGEAFFTMSERDVYINIPLIGDIGVWKKAAPVIEITDNKPSKSVGTITGSMLSAHWSVLGKGNTWYRKGKITFSVSLKKPDAFKLPPRFTPCTFDATPELLSLDINEIMSGDSKSYKISGKAQCLFTDINLKLICMKNMDGEWQEDTNATKKVHYTVKAGKGFGRCDKFGVFEAVLPNTIIEDDVVRHFVWKHSSNDGKIHGEPMKEKKSSDFSRQKPETAESTGKEKKD